MNWPEFPKESPAIVPMNLMLSFKESGHNRSWIGRQKLLTLRGAPIMAPSLGEPKLEPQIEGTEVKIKASALIEGLFQSMSKSCFCHESTVGYVDLLQKYSLRTQWLACGMERFPYIKCMQT